MTLDDLTLMLKSYGYICHTELEAISSPFHFGGVPTLFITKEARSVRFGWLDLLPAITYEHILSWLDTHYGNGQHHMHCACGVPVLQSVQGTVTMYYVYRLASQGPESEIVRFCPGCGQELTENVREMDNG